MLVFGLSFLGFLLAVAGMAVGVLAGRRALAGTCGGLSTPAAPQTGCCGCGRPPRGAVAAPEAVFTERLR